MCYKLYGLIIARIALTKFIYDKSKYRTALQLKSVRHVFFNLRVEKQIGLYASFGNKNI